MKVTKKDHYPYDDNFKALTEEKIWQKKLIDSISDFLSRYLWSLVINLTKKTKQQLSSKSLKIHFCAL